MAKLFNSFPKNKLFRSLLTGVLLIILAIVWSAYIYWLKHLYVTYGDVPFYQVDYHLILLLHIITTPLVVFPFIKYWDSKISFARIIDYISISVKAIFLCFIWSIGYFIVIRILYSGTIGLPFHLILFNALDWLVSNSLSLIFIIIGYFYMKKNINQRKQIDDNEKLILKNKLDLIIRGFEPHFLFNNLNILYQLIDSDKNKAKDFISDLAFLYRYIINSNKNIIISLIEEVDFAKKYLNILNVKFNNSFDCIFKISGANNYFIMPNTLQILIENAIKHNPIANNKKLNLLIELDDDQLIVSNEKIIHKDVLITSNRTGLQSLKERYRLGLNKEISVYNSRKTFTVIIPLISENPLSK